MKRVPISPRKNWQHKVEEIGFSYHSTGSQYWQENAYYHFTLKEIEVLETASNELHEMCLHAVQHIIDNDLFDEFKIPENMRGIIRSSWDNDYPSIYGRFDLLYDGHNPPKLLEYNADTPTSLFESAVVQWFWLEETFPNADQFNSIHDRLLAKWKELKQYLHNGTLYFAAVEDSQEDLVTVEYLRDCAEQAGIKTAFIPIGDIGWEEFTQQFVDMEMNGIKNCFKLYPWEWMAHEEFAEPLVNTHAQVYWMEPAWKILLSNKAILALLWELFPNHPNLLPAYFSAEKLNGNFVKKPFFSREGANITIVENNTMKEFSDGDYGEEGYVFQQYYKLQNHFGPLPVIGSWMIDGESAGIGIRESEGLITNNHSRFIPHVVE